MVLSSTYYTTRVVVHLIFNVMANITKDDKQSSLLYFLDQIAWYNHNYIEEMMEGQGICYARFYFTRKKHKKDAVNL